MLGVRIDDPVEEQAQEHAAPDETGYDWEHLDDYNMVSWELWLIGDRMRIYLYKLTQYEKKPRKAIVG